MSLKPAKIGVTLYEAIAEMNLSSSPLIKLPLLVGVNRETVVVKGMFARLDVLMTL